MEPGRIWNNTETAVCTICRSEEARTRHVVNGHTVVACLECGHLYLSPRPPMEAVAELYGEDYFVNPAFVDTDHSSYFGYLDYFSDQDNVRLQMQRILARIEDHIDVGRLVDVGCGPGVFVDVARQAGWDAAGIDPNAHAVKWGRENVAPTIEVGTLADLEAATDSVDVLTMFDVVEHLADPRDELRHAWRVLRPGGLLVVITPDAGAVVPRALGARWLELKRAPEHLQFFSAEGLAELLMVSGFKPIEWHSIGKITTLRSLLADLRFYSTSVFDTVEVALDRLRVADTVFDVDPKVKLCMYARKSARMKPLALDAPRLGRVRIPRVVPHGMGRVGLRRYPDPVEASPPRFRRLQDRYWERKAHTHRPDDPAPAAFVLPKLDIVARSVPIDRSTSFVDVGAGNGLLTWHLARAAGAVVAVELSQSQIAQSACRDRFVRGDIDQLPFADATFDIALESNVLHHADDALTMLKEMKRVAKSWVILIEPNRWHVPMTAFMAINRAEWRGLRFDRAYVSHLADLAELEVTDVKTQGAIYPHSTPAFLVPHLKQLDRPHPLGAYVVAVLRVPSGSTA